MTLPPPTKWRWVGLAGALAVAGALGALLLGRIAGGPPSARLATAEEQRPRQEEPRRPAGPAGVPPAGAPPAAGAAAADREARLEAVLGLEDDLAREIAMRRLFAEWIPTTPREAARLSERIESPERRLRMQQEIAAAWADEDPAAAFGWAATRPVAEISEPRSVLAPIVERLPGDFAAVLVRCADLPAGPPRAAAAQLAATRFLTAESAATFLAGDGPSDPDLVRGVAAVVLQSSFTTPEQRADWLARTPRSAGRDTVVTAWAEATVTDAGPATVEWLLALPEGHPPDAIESVVRRLAVRHAREGGLEALTQWIERVPAEGAIEQALLGGYLAAVAKVDPATAEANLQLLSPERQSIARRLIASTRNPRITTPDHLPTDDP